MEASTKRRNKMQSKNSKTYELVLTALFVAIIIAMALTPLGYIPLVVINATTLHIPVIIGSIFLGPKKGAFLGGVFGVTSLIKSSVQATSLSSFVFSPIAALHMLPHDSVGAAIIIVLKSVFIPVFPRVMIGVVPFFVFVGIKKMMSSKLKTVYGTILNAAVSFILGFGVYELFNGLITKGKLGEGLFFKFINEGDAITEGIKTSFVQDEVTYWINVYNSGVVFPKIVGAVFGILVLIAIEVLFMKKDAKTLAFTTAGVAGALTNTLLVMGSIFVLYNAQYAAAVGVDPSKLMAFIGTVISFNGVIEAVVSAIIVYLVGIVLDKIHPAGIVAGKN